MLESGIFGCYSVGSCWVGCGVHEMNSIAIVDGELAEREQRGEFTFDNGHGLYS